MIARHFKKNTFPLFLIVMLTGCAQSSAFSGKFFYYCVTDPTLSSENGVDVSSLSPKTTYYLFASYSVKKESYFSFSYSFKSAIPGNDNILVTFYSGDITVQYELNNLVVSFSGKEDKLYQIGYKLTTVSSGTIHLEISDCDNISFGASSNNLAITVGEK